jgi:Glutathione peroxidase
MEDPGFMLVSCPESCSRPEIESNFVSLYDIVETDINGKEFSFDIFKGSIVYIVNVASQCGYTAENYEMFRKLSKYRDDGVQMVLAPCNQVKGDLLFLVEPKVKCRLHNISR